MADLERVRKNLEERGFQTSYFATAKEAADYLDAQINGVSVGIGGSMTIQAMGLSDRLSQHNEVIWHWKKAGRETLMEARSAEVYITSANGVSKTGELVNIDGTGNRVSQTLFGPEKVYFVIGNNKVCPDLTSAMERAKQIAAPKNAARLQVQTPCAKTGVCVDCNSPARICHSIVILERPSNGMEVEVVFVDEEMGY